MKAVLATLLSLTFFATAWAEDTPSAPALIVHDPVHKTITISSGVGSIHLRVTYEHSCAVDQLQLMDREVLLPRGGVSSHLEISPAVPAPGSSVPITVSVDNRRAVIRGIDVDGAAGRTGVTET